MNIIELKRKRDRLNSLIEKYENRNVTIEISPRQTGKTTRLIKKIVDTHREYENSCDMFVFTHNPDIKKCMIEIAEEEDVISRIALDKCHFDVTPENFESATIGNDKKIVLFADEFDFIEIDVQKFIVDQMKYDLHISTSPKYCRNINDNNTKDPLRELIDIYGYTSNHLPLSRFQLDQYNKNEFLGNFYE